MRADFIRPTPLERAMGRLMRGPDHGDSGEGVADAGGEGNADAGGDGADQGADDGDAGSGADDATVLGSATADDGAGDGEGDDAEGKADADGDASDDDKAGPPETYELKVTTKDAEGKDVEVELDKELLTEATPVLKELNLTNEQANKLAPFVLRAQERMLQRQQDDFAATKADWAKEAKDDPEIGGKNWKETTSLAAKALDHFVGPTTEKKDGKDVPNEFRKLLNDTGLGNHPVMIRAFRKIGEAIGEDGTFVRGDAATVKKSREEVLYPEDAPKKE